MRNYLLTIILFWLCTANIDAQIQLSTSELSELYKSTSSKQISIHDPSVVFDPNTQYFYVYGSHYYGGKSKDLRNWTSITNYYNTSYDKAFKNNAARKVVRTLPGKSEMEEVDFPSFDAAAFCATYAGIKVGDREPTTEAAWVKGDQWAADVIWNPNMNKWCYYVSLNGDNWASVVVLMTSDKIEGPYTYQGPIVFGGFNGQKYSGKSVDYKKTDMEIVLGAQASLPSRYKTDKWGTYYPNCIDPCVFFDEEGEMWLAYGSWSGGIWMLKLDKTSGLRDYTYTYKGTGSTPNATSDDAYFGKRIAGGYYVSGEGPYIQHIGKYYYLFMSYGFFSPDGGYEMRVFRSESPTGPYKDAAGNAATYTSYQMNYGPNAATNKGMKLMGAMNQWGTMTVGECAQGHNSACVDDKGRSFLVCHTKYNNGTAGHNVRAYQLYLNKKDWLCAAPFQFDGETVNDEYLANNNPWSASDVEGDYHLLIHPYKLDYSKMAEVYPKKIHLSADGKVTGAHSGTWKFTDEGKSYFEIKLGSVTYEGVMVEQTLENNTAKALCFTAVCSTSGASSGVPVWGYKLLPQNAIAYNYQKNSSKFKLSSLSSISKNVDIAFDTEENTILTWESSNPDVVSNTGKYNPDTATVALTLTARLECGEYYWENNYSSKAMKATAITGDPYSGIVAYYDFDESPSCNAYNITETATTGRANTTTTMPKYEEDHARFGNVIHQYSAANGSNSYTRMLNPLYGKSFDGFTVSMWVKRFDSNMWDALWAFFNSSSSTAKGARLFFTGNCYLGYNDNEGNWFDVNHPDSKKVTSVTPNEWKLVTVTFSESNGYALYVDGTKLYTTSYSGSSDKIANFNKQQVLDFVSSSKYFYLGLGSFWGSAEAMFDDLLIYDRELSATDIKGLNTLLNRVNDLTPEGAESALGIENAPMITTTRRGIYDLMGRKVEVPVKGMYIIDGKKVMY